MEVYNSKYTADELEAAIDAAFSGGSYTDGYLAGKQAEYDAFWDTFQQNGARSTYNHAFAGWSWYDSNFKPKYVQDGSETRYGYMMFRETQITDARPIGDLKLGGCEYMFNGSKVQHIGRLRVVDANLVEAFSNCTALTTIDLLHLDNVNAITTPFTNCTSLKNVTFDGEIRKSLNMQWSPLSVDSMKSAITHLANYSQDGGNFMKHTLTFNEGCWAALEADGASPNGNTWKEYVEDLGWNAA